MVSPSSINSKHEQYVVYSGTLRSIVEEIDPIERKASLYVYKRKKASCLSQNMGITILPVHLTRKAIAPLVEDELYNRLCGGFSRTLESATISGVLNTQCQVVLEVVHIDKEGGLELNAWITFGHDKSFCTDLGKLEKEFEKAGYIYPTAFFESVGTISVDYIDFWGEKLEVCIKSLAKKFVREKTTYCFKHGKCTVSKEYLDRGKDGIEEWRRLERINSGAGTLERRIARKAYHNTKEKIQEYSRGMQSAIVNACFSYAVPSLDISGHRAKTREAKLASVLLEGKTGNEVMTMTDDDIEKMVREHWEKELTKALEAVKQCEVEKKEKVNMSNKKNKLAEAINK